MSLKKCIYCQWKITEAHGYNRRVLIHEQYKIWSFNMDHMQNGCYLSFRSQELLKISDYKIYRGSELSILSHLHQRDLDYFKQTAM